MVSAGMDGRFGSGITGLLYAGICTSNGKGKEAEEITTVGYSNTLDLILDEECNWPQKLEWGWVENYQICIHM